MKNKELKIKLLNALNKKDTLIELRNIIVLFKSEGGKREDALTTLKSLRENCKSENREDIILELMDFVAGFCSPLMKIW